MHRDKFTEKLVRILKTVDSGALPAKPKALYVFGSYSRGAIEPGDLDLLLVYDLNDRTWETEQLRLLQDQGYSDYEAMLKLSSKFEPAMRRAIRKPGEPIQVIVTQDLALIVGERSRIKPSDVILLWSDNDRDWKSKLEQIKVNETAGRAHRNHIVPLARLSDHVGTMEAVVDMIELERLSFNRIPIESIVLDLNAYHVKWLEWWTHCKVLGVQSTKTLPYAMWWLQSHRQKCQVPDRTEIWSKSRTHRLDVGKPSLRAMLWYFVNKPKIKRQCLIPHFKARSPNELLVFERGATWEKFVKGDPPYETIFNPFGIRRTPPLIEQ